MGTVTGEHAAARPGPRPLSVRRSGACGETGAPPLAVAPERERCPRGHRHDASRHPGRVRAGHETGPQFRPDQRPAGLWSAPLSPRAPWHAGCSQRSPPQRGPRAHRSRQGQGQRSRGVRLATRAARAHGRRGSACAPDVRHASNAARSGEGRTRPRWRRAAQQQGPCQDATGQGPCQGESERRDKPPGAPSAPGGLRGTTRPPRGRRSSRAACPSPPGAAPRKPRSAREWCRGRDPAPPVARGVSGACGPSRHRVRGVPPARQPTSPPSP